MVRGRAVRLGTYLQKINGDGKMREWLNDALFYEIYPQSFYDTNGDGIGDLQGIIEKLDYIKELGCNAIWINPCFDSPFGDAGYDVRDYKKIAARYGTNDDAKRLFDEVHRRGMHVFLDLVPGHTSIEHEWFKVSCKAEKNEYTDRYVWTDSMFENPTPLESLRGISEREGSCGVNFFTFQPALNYGFYEREKPWQQSMDDEGPKASMEAMKDVMRFWLDMGCDGFRVDMAHSMVKGDPESKGTILFWQRVRPFLEEEYPNACMVSEWGEPDKSIAGGFHMDFVLHFGPSHYGDLFREGEPYFKREGKGNVKAFVDKYMQLYNETDGRGFICIPSGNHDMERLKWKLDDEEIKIAFAFLLSMPGVPFIYYGDEIGIRYQGDLVSKEGGYFRTGARTPMQWNKGKNSGFSTASADKLYLPVDSQEDANDVESQMASADSLYSEVKKLIEVRGAHSALHNKAFIKFEYVEENTYPLVYIREEVNENGDDRATLKEGGERIMVILNPSEKEVSFETAEVLGEMVYINGSAPTQNGHVVTVSPCSAAFVRV